MMALMGATSAVLASIPSPPFQDLTIGPLSFRMYGLCIALAALAGIALVRRRWSNWGGDPEDMVTVALWAVPAGLIGARLYHVITDFSGKYSCGPDSTGCWWPDALFVWKGGLGIPGGIILGTVTGIVVGRRIGLDWKRGLDAAAPAMPLAQAIGRFGNWFNQELYGGPTDLPWGLRIDPEHRPLDQIDQPTFHPTFLYECLWNLGLMGLIIWGSGRWVFKRGRWFALYVVGYGVGRLWVEALRVDDATHILGLRVNIWTALLAMGLGSLWLFWGGSPLDREATERLRSGTPLSEIFDLGPAQPVPEGEPVSEGEPEPDPAE